eukprot:CAMPEP_0195132264 /NCGR_PEP_ID=MMETSP0448-20130528/146560_1 /TAXON_ID=66468 /ORGANISM="Heterocapsa triquestra, Strain CCMP 448" /LENGTH=48 /DNA_ID= /DNA_START= /DNA_END= /DNA_ORIENTATION=
MKVAPVRERPASGAATVVCMSLAAVGVVAAATLALDDGGGGRWLICAV